MKKILDFIFETVPEEENEEVVVNAPLVKHTFKDETTLKKDVEIKKEIQVNKDPIIAKVKPETEIKADNVKKADNITRKPTFGIEVNDLSPRKERPKTIISTSHSSAKKEKEYEFQPPMSPIFGVLENHEDPRIIVTQNKKTVSANNASYLGTVLSPIYGSEIYHDESEAVSEIIEEISETIPQTVIEETVEEVAVINDEEKTFSETFEDESHLDEIKDEDIINSSIDDILIKPKDETQIVNREISLFDDEEE